MLVKNEEDKITKRKKDLLDEINEIKESQELLFLIHQVYDRMQQLLQEVKDRCPSDMSNKKVIKQTQIEEL